MKKFFVSMLVLMAALSGWAAAPKYIFYFIGDGMGNGHVMGAYQYNRMVHNMETPLLLTSLPVFGMSTTYSANRPVTDSAAAGTALATGVKTRNNMLGMSADTVAVTSIATRLQADGYGIGILTTVAPDDATPGAFYAHQPSRKNYYEIGIEAANSGFEFIAGSVLRGVKDKDGNSTDLLEEFERNNVAVIHGIEALKGVDNRRVVLLDNDVLSMGQVGYTIDSIPGAMTLPDMTRVCLDHLEKVSPDKFFMMVEGGNIDWAGHANDGGAVIKEIIKFDEALRVAYDFYLAHPDETLIVVTADHDTGGMSVGNQFLHYDAKLQYIDAQRISKDRFADEVKAMLKSRRTYTWDEMKDYLTEKLGFWTAIPIGENQTRLLHDSFIRTFETRTGDMQESLYNKYPDFASAVFGILQEVTGIGWTTMNHTGNPVGVYAVGCGAQLFDNYHDNTDIPERIMQAVGK